ncbi:trypsin-like serine protease [Streptomyces sp. ASQP_92]|uniref:trypsin-like serine protease n=1 Tax=Streptomyces sp. ASQP_92 TaxID=2979116 RepID=UPI0021BE6FD1|nr:trypsin-like serine protease [Streptomyces sp. ASQP_92]MCT9092599.1 trypsin-like serine protease [Streptomyces sp. ASQP_92]
MSARSARTAWISAATAVVAATGIAAAPSAGATVGTDATSDSYAFTAKLNIGDGAACSGALVDPQWVLTAASCFPAADKPAVATTVTVGRTDLATTGGTVTTVIQIVPHPDRDIAMVKLAKPVTGIAPVKVATTAPAVSDKLTATGYGRTKTEWVPSKLHASTFTLASFEDKSVGLNGSADAVICQGDAGGPALRDNNGTPELVAVNSRSWQGGCLGTDPAETRTSAVNTRLDNTNGWVQQIRLATIVPNVTALMTSGDFNGDGITDVAATLKDGNLHAFYGRKDGTFEYGRPLWNTDGTWGKSVTKMVGGDFNGDGITDIAAVWANGPLRLYLGTANGPLTSSKPMWLDETTDWNPMLQLTRFKADASGRDGLLAVWNSGPKGALYAYTTAADGKLTGQKRNMWRDNTWQYTQKVVSGDFNNDGFDDVVALSDTGALVRYGNAQGSLENGVSMWPDNGWNGMPVVLAGDFDGDGNTDMGGLWNNQQRFNFYKGNGKGSITTGTNAWPNNL